MLHAVVALSPPYVLINVLYNSIFYESHNNVYTREVLYVNGPILLSNVIF